MKNKTLMILGGSRYVVPLIEKAHNLGVFVITCDYLPNNIAHKYSDLFLNISILDKEKILDAAKRFKIDGITSFGCDPGVITAAYVAEKLNLPSVGPFESVCILQNKGLFRNFLRENGFNTPRSKTFDSIDDALQNEGQFDYPIIVKPTDSAGSKGVTRVDNPKHLYDALQNAFSNSIGKEVIIEEFIEKDGCSSDSDCYSVDGKLCFVSFSNQYFDEKSKNPYTPAAFEWPSTMSEKNRRLLKNELQRLINLLGLKTSIYNVETRVSKNGKPYIMEVSPRGGGNRISEILTLHSGVDLIDRHLKDCLGIFSSETFEQKQSVRCGEIIVHSTKKGVFEKVSVDPTIEQKVARLDIWVEKGEPVEPFTGANKTIGNILLVLSENDSIEELMRRVTVEIK